MRVCVLLFLRRRGRDVVWGEERLCLGVHSLRACRGVSSPLYAASAGGHVSCVEALIGLKADVLQCEK